MRSVLVLGFFSLLTACGGDDGGATRCTPGRVDACPCAGGAMGVQTCQSDGTFAACTCGGVDAGGAQDAGGIDAAARVDSGVPGEDSGAGEDASTSTDSGSDSGTPPTPHGHVVLLGSMGTRDDDPQDAMIANSVLLSERPGDIDVVEYVAHSQVMTDPYYSMRFRGVVDAVAAARGRTVRYTTLATDSGLATTLAAADVLYVHFQGLADDGAMRTVAGFWHDDLSSFIDAGGVVVVTGNRFEYHLVEAPDLFSFASPTGLGSTIVTMEIATPSDPVAAGVLTPFPAFAGDWLCFLGSARGAVVARETVMLCPTVRHLVR